MNLGNMQMLLEAWVKLGMAELVGDKRCLGVREMQEQFL